MKPMAKKIKITNCFAPCPHRFRVMGRNAFVFKCLTLGQDCPESGVHPNCPLPDYDEGFQWISVVERLPDDMEGYVLAYVPSPRIETSIRRISADMLKIAGATHWSPLPPAPKGNV